LKARSSKIFDIKVLLMGPKSQPNFYDNFNDLLDTNIEFKEFATSTHPMTQAITFKPMKLLQ